MQVVVNIDEDTYKDIKSGKIYTSVRDVPQESIVAIANGTPLSKGYGRLISADSLIKAIEDKSKRLSNLDTINGLCGAVALIFDEPTIIAEASTESEVEE